MLRRQGGQSRLDRLAHHRKLVEESLVREQIQVLPRTARRPERRGRTDECTAAGIGPQIAHDFEQPQRLAYGWPADAEEVAELALSGEPLANRQAALMHERLQLLSHAGRDAGLADL